MACQSWLRLQVQACSAQTATSTTWAAAQPASSGQGQGREKGDRERARKRRKKERKAHARVRVCIYIYVCVCVRVRVLVSYFCFCSFAGCLTHRSWWTRTGAGWTKCVRLSSMAGATSRTPRVSVGGVDYGCAKMRPSLPPVRRPFVQGRAVPCLQLRVYIVSIWPFP